MLLLAFLGGLAYSTFELSMIRVGYQTAGNPLNAWMIALIPCLVGAGLAAIAAPRLRSPRAFAAAAAAGIACLAAMAAALPWLLAHLPLEAPLVSDLLGAAAVLPVAVACALPLAALVARVDDYAAALPACFIANAFGALTAPFFSMLCETYWGHAVTLGAVCLLIAAGAAVFRRYAAAVPGEMPPCA